MKIVEITKPVDGIQTWFKYEQDNAFEDIIDGWVTSGKEKYLEHVKGFDVVVQAGGYCGIHPRLFSQIFKAVYTFEPDYRNFYCLNLNCPYPNILKYQAALGEQNGGMVSVNQNSHTNLGMNTVVESNVGIVPTLCIDSFWLPACDLIQLDTEGYEMHILKGAADTIRSFKPVIVVEDTNAEIEKFLEPYGYAKKSTSYRDTIFSVS